MDFLFSSVQLHYAINPFIFSIRENKKSLEVLIFNTLKDSLSGTPEGTRTPNIQNRNLTLYPIELRALINRSVIIAGLP